MEIMEVFIYCDFLIVIIIRKLPEKVNIFMIWK